MDQVSRKRERDEAERRLRAWMIASLDGDKAAYHQVLTVLSGFLRTYFGRRLGSGFSEVEDLVQETLLAIHLKRSSYDRSLPFTPWAYAVARYKLIDHLRRGRRRLHVPLEDASALLATDDADQSAVRADLARMLDKLTDRQRSLIVDVKIQGYSVDEAAQDRGVTPVSARVMLHRSLKGLGRIARDEDQ